MHNFEIKISKNFLGIGSGGAKFHQQRHLPLTADSIRCSRPATRWVKTTWSFSTNYGRLRRNAQNEITYSRGLCTGWPKKVSHKGLSISLPNIDRFSNFFSLVHSVKNLW